MNWTRFLLTLTAVLVAIGVLVTCAVNPATGKRQIALYTEDQEIRLGQESHAQVLATYGLYDDPELQKYVQNLGKSLAANSERAHLDWTFTVVDDSSVNAFALPGGYIYITRGILAHLESEAELAGVIGHEIGHVTARHGVNRMSKAQLANLGLGIGSVLSPEFAQYGNLAGTGLELLLLKNSRDAERQADDLGVRYMARTDYDPDPMADVFETLRLVSEKGGGRMPGWLATHPAPENRRERIGEQIDLYRSELDTARVGHQEYLAQIAGIVFGDDPRQGYFKGNAFLHPEMRFRLNFPVGWETTNQRTMVGAINEAKDAMVQLTLAREESPEAARAAFFKPEGVSEGKAWASSFNGLPAVTRSFAATSGQTNLSGAIAFVELNDTVFQIMGYGKKDNWAGNEKALLKSLGTFRELTDRAALAVKPARVKVVTVGQGMTIEHVGSRYGSTVESDVLALMNRMEPGGRVKKGDRVKIVVGGELP